MSGTGNDFQNGAPFYLDATQQDLLLAALASNNQNPNDLFSNVNGLDVKTALDNDQFQYPMSNLDSSTFFSPQQGTPANAFSNMGVDESPFVEYLDGDNSFDFDGADSGAVMIGSFLVTRPMASRARSARVQMRKVKTTTKRAAVSGGKVKTSRLRSLGVNH